MKVYSYSNQTRGQEVASLSDDELRGLSGTLFSELGKKLQKGDRTDLEVGIGPEFVDVYHDVESAIQLAESGKKMSVDATNEVITKVCKSRIENQGLALVVAEIIK
ncbi:hypothetical protein [Bdellovibrio sp. BCCA]|uniref:hypothetical protein n=1 Tax=Bdellovibrio sp. BCCA TaxID=3136281 RepID=UPI0030F18378